MPVDSRIIEFIQKHHVLTLATSVENSPYTSTCFYVYDEKENSFIITSGPETRHASEMLINSKIAGAIALETSIVGKIQGIQFTGITEELSDKEFDKAHKRYIAKFPVAALAKLHLWKLKPDFIKMTHNRLGFGKKLIWKAE